MWILSALATVLGFGGFYLLGKEKESTTMGPPSVSVRDGTSGEASANVPWRAVALVAPSVAIPVRGRHYFAQVADPHGTVAVVEGIWIGDKDHSRAPGALRVHRVVGGTNVHDFQAMSMPVVPFTLEIPPSRSELSSDYLCDVEWKTISPERVGEKPLGRHVQEGERARFVLCEKDPGCALVVVSGRVIDKRSGKWPKEEGVVDGRVLLLVERVERRVIGGEDLRLPSVCVVDRSHLF